MPQDSLHIASSGSTPSAARDTAVVLVRPKTSNPVANGQKDYSVPALFFVLALFTLAFGIPYLWKRFRRYERLKFARRVYEDQHAKFDRLLSYYLPYYRSLNSELKVRFVKRTVAFMENKDFVYVDISEEEQMPLLISAAAIQLTFGLDHYLLDYFRKIYVLNHAYRFGLYNVPFEGHVNSDGIYLSWSNFAREMADYSDGSNVGLHEMAHALTYVNFTAGEGRDEDFRHRFVRFSSVARPLFNELKAGGPDEFLGAYAISDYNEFWAVSVEHFFEQPARFRTVLPALYSALVNLLKQDPLNPSILTSPIQEV